MAKLTIGLGIVLTLMAVVCFALTGSSHPTALIPAGVGLLFVLFGALAISPDPKRRMLWMHIAVTVALLMFLGTVPAVIQMVRQLQGTVLPHPIAVDEKAATSLLCLIFVALCVRSFIAARRSGALSAA